MKRFRNIVLLTALVTIIGLPTACEKISELTQFTMDYEESIVIPSTIGLNLPFNLAPYIIQDDFTLRFSTVTDKIPLSDHHIDISASFFVDARILGF